MHGTRETGLTSVCTVPKGLDYAQYQRDWAMHSTKGTGLIHSTKGTGLIHSTRETGLMHSTKGTGLMHSTKGTGLMYSTRGIHVIRETIYKSPTNCTSLQYVVVV